MPGLCQRLHCDLGFRALVTRTAAATVAGLTALTGAILLLPASAPVRLEVGGYDGGMLRGAWSRVGRLNLDPPAATDGILSFYFRSAPPTSQLVLPLRPRGNVRLA